MRLCARWDAVVESYRNIYMIVSVRGPMSYLVQHMQQPRPRTRFRIPGLLSDAHVHADRTRAGVGTQATDWDWH